MLNPVGGPPAAGWAGQARDRARALALSASTFRATEEEADL